MLQTNLRYFPLIVPHEIGHEIILQLQGSLRVKQARKSSEDAQASGTLGLKKFGPGRLRVEKVWAQNIVIDFLAKLDHSKKIYLLSF